MPVCLFEGTCASVYLSMLSSKHQHLLPVSLRSSLLLRSISVWLAFIDHQPPPSSNHPNFTTPRILNPFSQSICRSLSLFLLRPSICSPTACLFPSVSISILFSLSVCLSVCFSLHYAI